VDNSLQDTDKLHYTKCLTGKHDVLQNSACGTQLIALAPVMHFGAIAAAMSAAPR